MKNHFQIEWISCLLIAIIFSCTSPKETTTSTKPNILFISIDDLRPTLGVYGDSIAVTPNIDRFANEGTTFRQTFCQAAVCAPSRASRA